MFTSDSVFNPSQCEEITEAFNSFVSQVMQAAKSGLPKGWNICSREVGRNTPHALIWACKAGNIVNLFGVTITEYSADRNTNTGRTYIRLVVSTDKWPSEILINAKIWFDDMFGEEREPEQNLRFFLSSSEGDEIAAHVRKETHNK